MEEKRQLFYLKRQPPHNNTNLIIPFKREKVVIGRSPEAHYVIQDVCISRKHAVFTKIGNEWIVRNLSLNGVFVNDKEVPKDEEHPVKVGSIIQIGQPNVYVYRFGMKISSGKSSQSSTQNDPKAHLTQERDTLDARLQENDIRYQKLVASKNQLQEELNLEKEKMNEQYERDRKKLEEKHLEGSMAQQLMLAEKQELADKLEKEVESLQSKLESERLKLEEQLTKEEKQREELLESKDKVMEQLSAEKADLERRLEEERNRLEEQRLATEGYKKELQEQMGAKEELIQQKEKELEEAELKREQIAKQQEEIKQRLQAQLDEVSLKFKEKDTENSILDKELKKREEQLKQEMVSLEEDMARRMKEAVEAKETEVQQDAQKQLQLLKNEQNELQAKLVQVQETDKQQLDEMRNALDTLEAQKMSLEQELQTSATASQLARKEVVESVCDVMENEFQCPICSELFMTAILLNCGHTFCKFCIDTWKKNKKECPNCRQKITSENRSVVVDNFIDKIVPTLSEEMRNRRAEILQERKDEVSQAAAAEAAAVAARAAQRGGRRGARGRGRGHLQGNQEMSEQPSHSNSSRTRAETVSHRQEFNAHNSVHFRQSRQMERNPRRFEPANPGRPSSSHNNGHNRNPNNQRQTRRDSYQSNNPRRTNNNQNFWNVNIPENRRQRNNQNPFYQRNAANYGRSNAEAIYSNDHGTRGQGFNYYGNGSNIINQLMIHGLVNSNYQYHQNDQPQVPPGFWENFY